MIDTHYSYACACQGGKSPSISLMSRPVEPLSRLSEFVIAVGTPIVVFGVGLEQGIILAVVLSILEDRPKVLRSEGLSRRNRP